MMAGIILLLHVLGATVWTGGHIVLSLVVLPRALRERSPQVLLEFESVYEKVGMPALLTQIVTGIWLAFQWLPEWSQWGDRNNPLASLVLTKLVLLGLMFLLALHARFRVIPTLSAETLPFMAWHIVPVTLLSIGFVVVGVSFRTGWFY